MSSSLSSEDDRPLASSQQRTPTANVSHMRTNGAVNDAGDRDSPMSEDDMPLSQSARGIKSETASPKARALKRKKPPVGDSSSDDDTPLASSPPKAAAVPMPGAVAATTTHVANGNGTANGVKSKPFAPVEDDSDDDMPIAKKRSAANGKAPPKKKVKKESEDDASDFDNTPKMKRSTAAPKGKRKVKQDSDASETEENTGKSKKKRTVKKAAAKVKDEDAEMSDSSSPKKANGKDKGKKGKDKEKEEDEEDVYKWWEANADGDGSQKWRTLVHNGVLFPPPYEALPSNVKMKYKGKAVNLSLEAEEVAGFYAALLESDHAKDATFNKNFFKDWQKVLKDHPPRDGTVITDMALCDFLPIYEHLEAERARKKALTTAEKKEIKAEKDRLEEPYATCTLDGRKEKIGNFRVEPPGLFRGRGEHPKKGSLKFRVRPEDITLNIGEGVPAPIPNMPGKWKEVTHDNTVTWLATWTENINGQNKYVFLAAGSSLKGQSDMAKFEKARELKKYVDGIRQEYTVQLKEKLMAIRQRATAVYFIDQLALRAGNEKGEDEADTVGCCSLRCEHVTLEAPNFVIFDFLGKDSIRYYNRVAVDQQVYKNVRIFKDNKNDDDTLFDRVTTTSLNKYLQEKMKGLTAKVFRTYNASSTLQRQLDEGTPANGTVQEKLNAYNHANRMVAILCNHQRSVPKTHEQSMEKARDKIRSLKYERMKLRHALIGIDSKYKKKSKYKDDESDIDDDWIALHEEDNEKKAIEKAEKKFAKENEKAAEDGKEQQAASVLKERIADIRAEFKQLRKERGTGKHELKRARTADKLEDAIDKLADRIKTAKLQMDDRDAGKEIALGTSKLNYNDPRITAAWCAKYDVPIERIFSKTLLTKFPWALQVTPDWKF